MASLKGSKTEKNLKDAFAGEFEAILGDAEFFGDRVGEDGFGAVGGLVGAFDVDFVGPRSTCE